MDFSMPLLKYYLILAEIGNIRSLHIIQIDWESSHQIFRLGNPCFIFYIKLRKKKITWAEIWKLNL